MIVCSIIMQQRTTSTQTTFYFKFTVAVQSDGYRKFDCNEHKILSGGHWMKASKNDTCLTAVIEAIAGLYFLL